MDGALVGSSAEAGDGVVPGCTASVGLEEGATVPSIGADDGVATGNEMGETDGEARWGDGALAGSSAEVGGGVPGCTASVGPEEGGTVSSIGADDGVATGDEEGETDGEARWADGALVGSSAEVGDGVSGCTASVGPEEGGTVSSIGADDDVAKGEEVDETDGEARWADGALVGSCAEVGVPGFTASVGPEEGGTVSSIGADDDLTTGEEVCETDGEDRWADGAVVGPSAEVGGGVRGRVASIGAGDGVDVSLIGAAVGFVTGEEVGEADGGEALWADGAVVESSTEVGGDVLGWVPSIGAADGVDVFLVGVVVGFATGEEVDKADGEVCWADGALVGSVAEVGGGVPGWSVDAVVGFAVFSIGAVVGFATGEGVGESEGGEVRSANGAEVGSSAGIGGVVSNFAASVDSEEGAPVFSTGAVVGFVTGKEVGETDGKEVSFAVGVDVGVSTKIGDVLGCAVSKGPEEGIAVSSVGSVGEALGI